MLMLPTCVRCNEENHMELKMPGWILLSYWVNGEMSQVSREKVSLSPPLSLSLSPASGDRSHSTPLFPSFSYLSFSRIEILFISISQDSSKSSLFSPFLWQQSYSISLTFVCPFQFHTHAHNRHTHILRDIQCQIFSFGHVIWNPALAINKWKLSIKLNLLVITGCHCQLS